MILWKNLLLVSTIVLQTLAFAPDVIVGNARRRFVPSTSWTVPTIRNGDCTTVNHSLLWAGKGFGTKERTTKTKTKSNEMQQEIKNDGSSTSTFPPMSKDEISQWMNHIPVYAVTDMKNDSTKAIQLNEKAVVYFFMSPVVAEAHKRKLEEAMTKKESGGDDGNGGGGGDGGELTVSGMFLGKIWFDFLHPQSQEEDIEYRLVPDPRDLTSARTILSMESPEYQEDLNSKGDDDRGGGDDDDGDHENDDIDIDVDFDWSDPTLTAFTQPYNEIPLFFIDSMPLTDKNEEVMKVLNQMVSSSYMFFSSQNMFRVLDKLQASGESLDSSNDALCSLYEVVKLMQDTSTVDFRNIVLIPPAPIEDGTVSDSVLAKQLEDPSSLLSQSFFLPLYQR